MLDMWSTIIRIILEFVVFVIVYYFVIRIWSNISQQESLKHIIITGLIWVTIYELIIHFFI